MAGKGTGRTPLVLGNWKMNGDSERNAALLDGIVQGLGERAGKGSAAEGTVEIGVLPPFPYLSQVGQRLLGTAIGLGAQNVARQTDGAFTGEVSATMLKDLGCRWVLIGHSERRQLFGDLDSLLAEKCRRAFDAGLRPVLCVGETLEDRKAGSTEKVLALQIDAVCSVLQSKPASEWVVAYEPVWAIGTGLTATPEQAQQAHAFIRDRLKDGGVRDSQEPRLLYGGSVKSANAAELFAGADVDGGLIGGAALVADDFVAICRAAAQAQ